MTKITNKPDFRRGGNESEALKEMSDDLRKCVETLQAMNMRSEVNTQNRLLSIVEKLPYRLYSRWQKEVTDMRNKHKCLPTTDDVVKFVTLAAEKRIILCMVY